MTREGACPHPSEAAVCKQCSIERRAAERAQARTDGGAAAATEADAEAEGGFAAIIAADVFDGAIDAVDCLVNECKIHLDEGGLRIAAVDPANVGMVSLDLDAPAFEAYDAHGGTIGVDLERLGDVVGMADSGDLVHLRLDAETRKLHIDVGGLSYTLALIDPDSIRQEPDIPELDLPATVRVPAGDIERGVTAADLCSDHITFAADADAFRIEAEGDTDDVTVTVPSEECQRHETSESVRSLFSLDYLDDMTGPMAGDVTVRLGDEFPVKLMWEFAEGHGEVTFALAPRIQSD
jgi:proliferating cell nuclear antigen